MSRRLRNGFAAALAVALLAVIPAFTDDSQGDKVVVTKPGVVFHKAGSGDIRGRAVARTVDSALEAGYTPCPVCFAKEISVARNAGPMMPGAAATMSFGAEAIAATIGSVSQPYGIHYQTRAHRTGAIETVRDPYADVYTIVPGRWEIGAYGQR